MLSDLASTVTKNNKVNPVDQVDDDLIEQIWQDLRGQVPHEQIRQTAGEIASQYRNATITTFVPIFIRRQTRELLRRILREQA